ncbi:hypothetical protein [Reichenbachiella sp.]|uniref:hypothetical protein n=1 Tax=Reichenbachiella sp. TaxID=2184521 RepID=UPI003BAF3988
MAKWEKIGLIFSPQKDGTSTWSETFAQAPCAVVHSNFVRVYFSTRPKPTNGQYVSNSGYVDLDRNNLTKIIGRSKHPILPLGKLGTFDEFGIYPVSVIKNQDGHYVCYYAGWTRCASVPFNVAIGMAISKDDGRTFEKIGEGPILPYTPDEPFILSGPKIRRFQDQWVLWYIAGRKWILDEGKPEPIYSIRMATSDNGLDWTRYNRNLIPDILENEAQASPDVIYHGGKYHMFFSFRHGLNYRGKKFGYRIGYAHSSDMINWTRDDSQAGIDISKSGWDDEMISYPNVFELDGEIYLFYLGNDVGKEGFGLARLVPGTLT